MYRVDERDRVRELKEVPQSSAGAPIPLVIADEHDVVIAYYLQNTPPGWNGESVRIVSASSGDEPIGLVRFNSCYASMFGPPNDEAFSGHPLASRGLHPYGSFRVEESSWIRSLERMNSVHQDHKPERFWERQHLIWTFHDSTFECVCKDFEVFYASGSIESIIPEMQKKFRWGIR